MCDAVGVAGLDEARPGVGDGHVGADDIELGTGAGGATCAGVGEFVLQHGDRLLLHADQLTVEQYGQPLLDEVKAALTEAEVKQAGAAKVGPREAWMFEVHGKAGAAARAVVKAVTFRPEDKVVLTVTLECPAERVAALKRDLTKVLRKARV